MSVSLQYFLCYYFLTSDCKSRDFFFFIVPKIFAKLSRFKWCFILIIRMISKLMAYVLIKWCFQTTKLIYPRIFL